VAGIIIYYAHSIALYDTPQEARDVALLGDLGFEVYNPNNEKDAAGYKTFGMKHFQDIVQNCMALAFRANPDGSINTGVAEEIELARNSHQLVIELPSGVSRRKLTVQQTRELLREQGVR